MFYVDNSSGVPVMPEPSAVSSDTDLFFTEGGNGVPPTYPGPDWFNSFQTELINVVRAAGIDLDKMNNTQLLTALGLLTLSRKNPFADIAADGDEAVAAALANLGLGAAATRDIGTDNNQIPDMGSFTSGTGTNSVWFKFPNGMIIQAGYIVTSSSAAVTITFPTAFTKSPTAGGVAYSLTPTATQDIVAGATGSSLTTIAGVKTFNTSSVQQANGVFWIAVGN